MKYTFIKQHDSTDCAAACLAMVCLHYKKETSITKLRDLMGTDLKGTNLAGICKCAGELGFISKAIRVDKSGFVSKYTMPCIANVITKEGLSHFVVIFKVNKKYVILGDPSKELMKISIDDFYKTFTGVMVILSPTTDFINDKSKKDKIFFRFVKLLLPQKKLFIYSILASVIVTILGIASSLFNKIIMDEILPYGLKNTLLLVLLIFVVISLTKIIIGSVRQWMMLYLSQKIDIPLMLGYFEHIYKLPMKFFANRKTGDIITRFSDAFTIKDIFTNIALTLIIDIFMAVITGIILYQINLKLFMLIFLMTIISILLIFIFKHPYKKINEEQMQQNSVLNSQIIEGLRGFETIKSNANEDSELNNIEKEYIKSLRIEFKEGILSNVQGIISELISTVGNLALMYFGIIQVIKGDMTLGSMMAFMTLSAYFMDPVGRMVSMQLQIQEANISMQRLAEIMEYDTEENVNELNEIGNIQGDIEVKNLTFRYGNRQQVLKNINFAIPKGHKVALVGASGSGKSTIAKLMLKYYEPESGSITIDGVELSEYSNSSVRKTIGYVPQNIELFSKSIFDNIRISKMNSTLEEVKEAAKAADAHEFIKRLPMQYNTYLEEAGGGLSGGEKQRIALARAFLKNSDFYILDESTSNLDFATENIIFNMIYHKFKSKSMLIIAHRLATIKNCDEIIVLEKGEIIEKGTHDELILKKGKYYELWEMQQGNFLVKEEPQKTNLMEFLDDDDTLSYT